MRKGVHEPDRRTQEGPHRGERARPASAQDADGPLRTGYVRPRRPSALGKAWRECHQQRGARRNGHPGRPRVDGAAREQRRAAPLEKHQDAGRAGTECRRRGTAERKLRRHTHQTAPALVARRHQGRAARRQDYLPQGMRAERRLSDHTPPERLQRRQGRLRGVLEQQGTERRTRQERLLQRAELLNLRSLGLCRRHQQRLALSPHQRKIQS